MGKYLKLFETHTEYEEARQNLILPNVSYCEDNNDVYYNPLPPPLPNNIIIYKAESKLTETTSSKSHGSLNTAKFNTTMVSHTFEDGVGTIEFEEDVTEIYNCAFADTNITEIQLPNTLVSIGMDVFAGYGTFWGCSALTSVTIPNSVTGIGYGTFYKCSGLTSVTIPNSVTSIGNSAFTYCTSLTSAAIPSGVTSIGNYAFSGCSGLISVTIGSGVTSIGNSTFCNCSGLTSVTIPDSVTSIGASAFFNCNSLTSVTIGDGVTSIGGDAFFNCNSLTSVTINAVTPPTISYATFDFQNNHPIYVPSTSVETYKAASGWSDYAGRIQEIP